MSTNRRKFLKKAAAATTLLTGVSRQALAGTPANVQLLEPYAKPIAATDNIRIGLIGSGIIRHLSNGIRSAQVRFGRFLSLGATGDRRGCHRQRTC